MGTGGSFRVRAEFDFVGCAVDACDWKGRVFFSESSSERPPFWVGRKGSTDAMPERPFRPGTEGASAVTEGYAVFGGTEPVLLALSFLGDEGADFGLVAEVFACVVGGVSESMSISSGSAVGSSAVAWYLGRDFSG